jgi:hypothetical protein
LQDYAHSTLEFTELAGGSGAFFGLRVDNDPGGFCSACER